MVRSVEAPAVFKEVFIGPLLRISPFHLLLTIEDPTMRLFLSEIDGGEEFG